MSKEFPETRHSRFYRKNEFLLYDSLGLTLPVTRIFSIKKRLGGLMKIRLLLLTYQGDIAGSTNSISYLAKGLASRDHDVFVGCRRESLLWSLLEDTPVERIPMTFHNKIDIGNMQQIRDAVRQNDIRIINAQSSRDRYTSILANWMYGLRTAVIHTRRQTPKSAGFFLQNWFYTWGTKKIVAVSRGIKRQLVKTGIPARHIHVIFNGTPREKYDHIEPERVERLRHKFGLHIRSRVIGCVSRNKRQEQLLQALEHIKHPMNVIMVGARETTAYRTITSRYQVPHRIIYTGFVSGEDALATYRLFDLFVLPSVTEGLSQAILEAMAMGVPVIATRAAGNIDLIQDGINGLHFADNYIEELTSKIEMLLDDTRLREKLIVNGKKTAFEDFSIERTIAEYEKFYLQFM